MTEATAKTAHADAEARGTRGHERLRESAETKARPGVFTDVELVNLYRYGEFRYKFSNKVEQPIYWKELK